MENRALLNSDRESSFRVLLLAPTAKDAEVTRRF